MEEASEQWGRATPHVIHGCLACKNHGPVLVPGNDATFGAQSQKRYGGVPACPRQTAPRLATCIPVTSTCLALPVCKCLQKEGREEKEREREREEKGEKREKKISYCESPTTASTRSAPTTGPGHTVAAVDGTVTSSSLQPLSICLGSRPTTAMTQRKHVSYDVVRHPPSPSSLSERLFFFSPAAVTSGLHTHQAKRRACPCLRFHPSTLPRLGRLLKPTRSTNHGLSDPFHPKIEAVRTYSAFCSSHTPTYLTCRCRTHLFFTIGMGVFLSNGSAGSVETARGPSSSKKSCPSISALRAVVADWGSHLHPAHLHASPIGRGRSTQEPLACMFPAISQQQPGGHACFIRSSLHSRHSLRPLDAGSMSAQP